MAALILPSRRVVQPQGPVEVSTLTNPRSVWVPGLGDLQHRAAGTLDADVINQLGKARRFTNVTSQRQVLDTDASWIPAGGGFSLLVVRRYGSVLGTGSAFGNGSAATVARRAAIDFSSSGNVLFDFGGATSGTTRLSAPTNTADGQIHTFVATTGPAGMRLFDNGRLIGSNAANPTRTVASAFGFVIGDGYGGTSGNWDASLGAAWTYQLSDQQAQELSAVPLSLFVPVQRRIWVSVGGSAGNATGSLAAISLSAATGSGSGAASAASAPSAVSLTAPQGTASGGATGFASGAPAAVSLSAPTASAVGSASATGAPAGVSLSAPQASAQGSASASGALDGIDLSAPTANATAGAVGLASGALAPISLAAATGTATGSAIASAAYAGITLSAPTGSASAGQVGLASGALAPIGTTAPQGSATGAAAAFAAYTGITLTPAQGTANATSPVGNAAGSLRAISLTAMTATANDDGREYDVVEGRTVTLAGGRSTTIPGGRTATFVR